MSVLLRRSAAVWADGPDQLHVLADGQRWTVRARGLAQLHEQLSPYLDGRFGRDQLLAQVPDGARAGVASYLDRLSEAGALAAAQRLNVTPADVSVVGVGEACQAAVNLAEELRDAGPARVLIIVEGTWPDTEALQAYIQLVREASRVAGDRPPALRIYALNDSGLTNRLTLTAPWPTDAAERIAEALGAAGVSEHGQVPLASSTSSFAWEITFGPNLIMSPNFTTARRQALDAASARWQEMAGSRPRPTATSVLRDIEALPERCFGPWLPLPKPADYAASHPDATGLLAALTARDGVPAPDEWEAAWIASAGVYVIRLRGQLHAGWTLGQALTKAYAALLAGQGGFESYDVAVAPDRTLPEGLVAAGAAWVRAQRAKISPSHKEEAYAYA
ncbi:MAG: hypothetical protein AAGI08_13855 [Bacteroidota bacterium]